MGKSEGHRNDPKFLALRDRIEGKVVELTFLGGDAFEKEDNNYWLPPECWEKVAIERPTCDVDGILGPGAACKHIGQRMSCHSPDGCRHAVSKHNLTIEPGVSFKFHPEYNNTGLTADPYKREVCAHNGKAPDGGQCGFYSRDDGTCLTSKACIYDHSPAEQLRREFRECCHTFDKNMREFSAFPTPAKTGAVFQSLAAAIVNIETRLRRLEDNRHAD